MTSSEIIKPQLQLVAWEVTGRCNLRCAHCRMAAGQYDPAGELTTEQCFGLVDQILEGGQPIIILTGGEPLMRQDIFEIGQYATGKGLRVVMGSNGTMLTQAVAARLKSIPIARLSVSIDFPTAEGQDRFRGVPGAFTAALEGIRNAIRAGIEIQINTTVTKLNVAYLPQLLQLALDAGAVAFHPFLLVPTGRGKDLAEAELSPRQYEETLGWIFDKQQELGGRIFFKPTDAPHYMRIVSERRKEGAYNPVQAAAGHPHGTNALTRGCLAGTRFCFISATGKVKGCGYLNVEAGDIKQQPFPEIWNNAPLFQDLRDLSKLKGKCGLCEYKTLCGGCRARAYEATGDYLEAEPYCIYEPIALCKGNETDG